MNIKGFTLIEILLYLFLISTLILIFVNLYVFSVNSQIKGEIMLEMNQEGALILETIKKDINNSKDVFNSDDTHLSLIFYNGETAEYVFEEDILKMTRGSNESNLTSSYVLVKNGKFTMSAMKMVNVSFDLEYLNLENNRNYKNKEHFYGGATITK